MNHWATWNNTRLTISFGPFKGIKRRIESEASQDEGEPRLVRTPTSESDPSIEDYLVVCDVER